MEEVDCISYTGSPLASIFLNDAECKAFKYSAVLPSMILALESLRIPDATSLESSGAVTFLNRQYFS